MSHKHKADRETEPSMKRARAAAARSAGGLSQGGDDYLEDRRQFEADAQTSLHLGSLMSSPSFKDDDAPGIVLVQKPVLRKPPTPPRPLPHRGNYLITLFYFALGAVMTVLGSGVGGPLSSSSSLLLIALGGTVAAVGLIGLATLLVAKARNTDRVQALLNSPRRNKIAMLLSSTIGVIAMALPTILSSLSGGLGESAAHFFAETVLQSPLSAGTLFLGVGAAFIGVPLLVSLFERRESAKDKPREGKVETALRQPIAHSYAAVGLNPSSQRQAAQHPQNMGTEVVVGTRVVGGASSSSAAVAHHHQRHDSGSNSSSSSAFFGGSSSGPAVPSTPPAAIRNDVSSPAPT